MMTVLFVDGVDLDAASSSCSRRVGGSDTAGRGRTGGWVEGPGALIEVSGRGGSVVERFAKSRS